LRWGLEQNYSPCEYIESKIPSQTRSFPVHFYDIIKCFPNCARWLPITRLSNSNLPKVVCNHMPLIMCFSMTVLKGGGGLAKNNNIYFFPPYMEHPRPYIIAKTSTMAELLRFCITFCGHFCEKISYAIQAGFAFYDCQFLANNLVSGTSCNA